MTTTKAPKLSEAIVGLLQLLARGAGPNDTIACTRHAGRALGASELMLPVATVSSSWIPGGLLRLLEQDFSPWGLGLAVRRPTGRGLLLPAVGAWFPFQRTMRHPTKPDSPYGKQWVWPDQEIGEAIARAEAFLPTSAVVDARGEVVALWALAAPVPTNHQDAAVRRLLNRIAARVGARELPADARLDGLEVWCPGFDVRNGGGIPAKTHCIHLDLERRYTLEQLEAALAAAPMPAPTPEPAARATARAKR